MVIVDVLVGLVYTISIIVTHCRNLLVSSDVVFSEKRRIVRLANALDNVAVVCGIVWLTSLVIDLASNHSITSLPSSYLGIVFAVALYQSHYKSRVVKYWVYFSISIAIAAILTGCGASRPQIVPSGAVEVSVPVPVCGSDISRLSAPRLDRPTLPITVLKPSDRGDYNKVSVAYSTSVALLTEYATALERDRQEVSENCRNMSAAGSQLNTRTPLIPVHP